MMAMNAETAALGVLLILTVATVAAVRKVREQDLWLNELRRRRITQLDEPLAGITDGLTGDEMHRILVSVAAEAREIRRGVGEVNDYLTAEAFEAATKHLHDRLGVLIRCVEALCERLQPCITEKEVSV